jgi:hypothetical protein
VAVSREGVKMPKYRKKPVVIEAVEWKNDGDGGSLNAIVAMDGSLNRVSFAADGTPALIISTLEGDMRAEVGDFIICGVKGELYPCKPDVFATSYEAVEASELAALAPVD